MMNFHGYEEVCDDHSVYVDLVQLLLLRLLEACRDLLLVLVFAVV